MNFLISIAYLIFKFNHISMHGYMIDPVSRSSAWRVNSSFPIYYNDMVF